MEGSTANRIPLVTSGDLDGRVLKLSRDGNWLLYTPTAAQPDPRHRRESPFAMKMRAIRCDP